MNEIKYILTRRLSPTSRAEADIGDEQHDVGRFLGVA